MLAVQTNDGDLRVWSVAKSYSNDEPAKVVRILKRTENYQNAPNWMGWSKNGRIIQFSERSAISPSGYVARHIRARLQARFCLANLLAAKPSPGMYEQNTSPMTAYRHSNM